MAVCCLSWSLSWEVRAVPVSGREETPVWVQAIINTISEERARHGQTQPQVSHSTTSPLLCHNTEKTSQQRTFLVWKEVGGGNVSKCRINLGKQVNSKKVSLIDYCWCGKSSQWRGLSLKGGGPTRLAHWNPSQSNMEQSSHQSSWNSVFEMEFQKPLQ